MSFQLALLGFLMLAPPTHVSHDFAGMVPLPLDYRSKVGAWVAAAAGGGAGRGKGAAAGSDAAGTCRWVRDVPGAASWQPPRSGRITHCPTSSSCPPPPALQLCLLLFTNLAVSWLADSFSSWLFERVKGKTVCGMTMR